MRRTFHLSIRHRILIALLLVVTAVVSAITFTMANLFHADKKVYVSDLASVVALNTAEKADALITGYGERLLLCARIYEDPSLSKVRKGELLADLMRGFRGCVALSFSVGNEVVTTYYDNAAMEAGRLSKETLEQYRVSHPLPLQRLSEGRLVVENSTFSKSMPAITVAVPGLRIPGEPIHVASALLRLDDLQRMSHESQAFEVALVDAQGTLVSHRDPHLLMARKKVGSIPVLSSPSAAMVSEYSRGGVDWIGGYARVESADLVVAAEIPKSAAFFASRELLRHLIVVALALLMISALVGMIWSRSLTGPIGRLAQATRTIAKGDFDVHVKVKPGDEIGTLAESFNQMATELHGREKALKDAQAQLIQSEKMAAFGQLGAGFAHEIKNPLAGIQGLAQLLQLDVEKESSIHQGLVTVEKETKRCRAIIDNLMKFARQEKVAFAAVDAAVVIGDAAAIMEHQLGIHGVALEKSIETDLPPILANANQLQQVLMNLILNAQQAFDGRPGKVRVVATRGPGDTVELRVEDEGPGIPKHIQARLFEPFFTTKPPGKGTGLGLSVSYGIVLEHKGTIAVESEPGQGTTFIIRIPEAPKDAEAPTDNPFAAGVPSNPNVNPTHLPHPHDGVKFKRSEPTVSLVTVPVLDDYVEPPVTERMPVDETFDHLRPSEALGVLAEPVEQTEQDGSSVEAPSPVDAGSSPVDAPAPVETPFPPVPVEMEVVGAPADPSPAVEPPLERALLHRSSEIAKILEAAAAGVDLAEPPPGTFDPESAAADARSNLKAWSNQLAWAMPTKFDPSMHDSGDAIPEHVEPDDFYSGSRARAEELVSHDASLRGSRDGSFPAAQAPAEPQPQPFHLMPQVQEFSPIASSEHVLAASPGEPESFEPEVLAVPEPVAIEGIRAGSPEPSPLAVPLFQPFGLRGSHPDVPAIVEQSEADPATIEMPLLAESDARADDVQTPFAPQSGSFGVVALGQPFDSSGRYEEAPEYEEEAPQAKEEVAREVGFYENEALVEIDPRATAFAGREGREPQPSSPTPVAFEIREPLEAWADEDSKAAVKPVPVAAKLDPRAVALANVEAWAQQLALALPAAFGAPRPVEEMTEAVAPVEPTPVTAELDPRAVALANAEGWAQQLALGSPVRFGVVEPHPDLVDATEPGELERLLVDRSIKPSFDPSPAETKRVEAIRILIEKVRQDPDLRDYPEVRNGFQRVEAGAEGRSSAGDVALLHGYIKILDPRSPIREGEFASAERVAGVPDPVRRLYNQAINGRELTERQRAQVLSTCRRLHEIKKAGYDRAIDFFKRQADAYEVDARRVLPALAPPDTGKTKPIVRPWMKPKKRAA